MELQTLLDSSPVDYREVDDTGRTKSTWPTFVISRNGKQITLSGYQTTAKILEELRKL